MKEKKTGTPKPKNTTGPDKGTFDDKLAESLKTKAETSPGGSAAGAHDILENHLLHTGQYRYNTVAGHPEILNKKDWKPIEEYDLNSIVRRLKKLQVKGATKTAITELLGSNLVEAINPIQEYFTSLPDAPGDPIRALLDTIELKQECDRPFVMEGFKKWIIGTVANVFCPDRRANHLCVILVGEQGTYKSTFIKNLCPPGLDRYFADGRFDPDDKDSIIKAAKSLIFNVDDYFADITGRKANALKGFMTQSHIDVRPAYAVYSERRKIYASFIASSNEATFLHDPTGNRRFLPVEVKSIDINAAQKIDIRAVWSQAYKLYKANYVYWLNHEEQRILNEYNGSFEIMSTEYEALTKHYRPKQPADLESPDHYQTTTDLIKSLNELTGLKMGQKKMGEALRKAGFEMVWKRRAGKQNRYWQVVRLDPDRDRFDDNTSAWV